MNIVYVETQRKDGTWKTWNNVAIPVKFGKLLDEQLDYAQVTLTRIKKNRFIPMTKARITVESETDDNSGAITLEYLVADDVSEETPVGSGIFNHTLTLIEYTKFLECFPLETLCFTNPGGNDYLSGVKAITPDIDCVQKASDGTERQGEEYTFIKDYSSIYRTPMLIGDSLRVADLQYPQYDTISYSGDFDVYMTAVKVVNKNGEIYLKIDRNGIIQGDNTFVITEGKNTITYKFSRTSFTGTGIASYKIEETSTFTIYGVKNHLPLAPYTINEVIQRTLQLVEPLRKNETPRFTFDVPTEKSKVFNQFAPEFTFTRSTLREALQQIGGHIHAEPRLTHENKIVWDFYGEEKRAEYTNYKTGETRYLSEYKYHTLQRKRNLDDTANALDSYQDNLVNRLNWGNSTTATPYDGAYQTLRMETAWAPSAEDNAYHIETVEPIDRIVSVKMRVYNEEKPNDYEEKPITPYIYEKKAYDNLSGISETYPNAKVTSLYYTHGQKGIYGLFYKNPSIFQNGIGKKYAITNIYNYAFGKSESKLDYHKIQFCVEYVPIYSTRVQQTKQLVQDFLPLPRTVNYTQSANSVEAQYFGEHIKGAIARMGNAEKNISMNFRNVQNIPQVGKLFDDEYYISECSVSVLQDHFECTLGLSKNFNRKSKYIGANSIKRIYEVSEEQVQERHTVLQDYLVITSDDSHSLEDIASYRANGYFNSLESICAMFNGVSEADDYTVAAVNAFGLTYKGTPQESVLLPVITSAFGNSLEFTWRYKDNFSAGFHAEEEFDSGNGIKRIFTVETEYTDYYGRLYYYIFGLGTATQIADVTVDVDLLPKYTPDNGKFIIGVAGMRDGYANPLVLRKDGRETLKFTYNVNVVTDDNKFIIGTAFTANNPLITKDTRRPHLYVLPYKINRFANVLDLENAKDLGEAYLCVLGDLSSQYAYSNGKTSNVEGEAWAYAYPLKDSESKDFENESGEVVSIPTQTGGELIFGKNEKVTTSGNAGFVRIYHVHDIYKYYEYLKNKEQNN